MPRAHRSVAVASALLGVVSAAVALFPAPSAYAQTQVFSLESPKANAKVFGIVEVKGYLLDVRGISGIMLLVDGVPVHAVDINQPRGDVRRKYPHFFGGQWPYEPGFRTSFLASNYSNGPHTVALLVTYAQTELDGTDAQTEELGTRTVTVDKTLNQPPLGALDSPRDELIYGTQDMVWGVYPITGWAIDDQAIRSTTAADGHIRADIEVLLDDRVVGQVIYPLPRPDVSNMYPDVAGAFNSGWLMNLNTANYTNGPHTIAVRAWDTLGKSRVFATRNITIDNNYATLAPFGKIDWPMNNGHFFSIKCSEPPPISPIPPVDPTDHMDWVSGWVVDQNDNARFKGVKYVEMLLDGVMLAATSRDCFFEGTLFLQNVNCYGFERPDILYQYPQFGEDSKYAGFFFIVNAKNLMDAGIHRGLHYLAIRVGTQDPNRPAVIIDEIPIILDCNDNRDAPSFGELEIPVNMQDMKGIELVKGWDIDLNSLNALNFYVDGILDGSVVSPSPNIYMYRGDIEAEFPWLPFYLTRFSGFQYFLDTSKYVDGIHQLVIQSVDANGRHNYWVQRPVVFNNVN
jgi:hypothetical protein